MGWKRIGGLALALAMTWVTAAGAATPFNLGPGLSPDVKVDAAGRAHAAWVEFRGETGDMHLADRAEETLYTPIDQRTPSLVPVARGTGEKFIQCRGDQGAIAENKGGIVTCLFLLPIQINRRAGGDHD